MKRREFLQAGAASAALLPTPRALGANDRIRTALIGAGGRGRSIARWVNDLPNAEVAAVADLYAPRRDQAVEQLGNPCKPVDHYKRILDDKTIDGVLIGAPDHWHAPLILEVAAAGKDVYCEKPITQNAAEGEKLLQGVESSAQIVQTGTQQRSWDHFIQAKDVIHSGALGQVTFIECYWYQNYRVSEKVEHFDTSKLDWDLWLGDRPKQPFDPMKFRRWRFFWDFGGGIFTDLLTHWIDTIQWIMDSPAPKTVQASGTTHFQHWVETPDTVVGTMLYPQNFTVMHHSSMIGSLEGGGIVFRGEKAMLKLTRDGFALYPEGIIKPEITRLSKPRMQVRRSGDGTRTNVANWLDCMRSRQQPNAPVRAGVEAALTAHLCNQAMREKRIVTV